MGQRQLVAGHRQIRSVRHLCLRLIKHAFRPVAAVLVFVLAGCATMYNPATEQREFIAISTGTEVAMGEDIHRKLQQEYRFVSGTAQWERLQRIGARVAAVSDRQDYEYEFYLIDKDQLNAFTIPGGRIYFFTGLMDKLDSDAQIAGVLAHEVGHCAARHTVKKFQAALGYNLIGSLVLSQVGGEQARQVFSMSANTLMNLIFSSYSRQDEFESDKLGVKYMHLAGYDLDGMIKTLEVLEKESKGADVPVILRTHPHIEDRIEEVRGYIREITSENPPEWVVR